MYRLLTLFVCMAGVVAWAQPAQKTTTEEYISLFRQVAVEEMYRTGIPASIKLAQGILESGSGNSRLAREANNHFGIKCHREWTGESVREDDDAPDECFRKYDDAIQSYLDHSAFLTTRDRYAGLFALERTDYKGWAHGLKQAGYATNPQYAPLLIGVIERYGLHQYDYADPATLAQSPTEPQDSQVTAVAPGPSVPIFQKGVFETNRIKTVFLQHGETLADIAAAYDISERLLARWNETDRGNLMPGMKVFLQPKRAKGATSYHRVAEGETMYRVAQMYGIKLDDLYARNLMEAGSEPAAGERIYLRKKRSTPPVCRQAVEPSSAEVATSAPESQNIAAPAVVPSAAVVPIPEETGKPDEAAEAAEPQEKKPVVEAPVSPQVTPRYTYQPASVDSAAATDAAQALSDELPDTTPAVVPDVEVPAPPTATPAQVVTFHTVQQGQTLYSISRQYGVSIDLLRQWNDLPDTTIRIGQTLIVGGLE